MAESLSTFATLFRATLMLYGTEPPASKREIVAATAQQLKLDGKRSKKYFNIRENNFNHNLEERRPMGFLATI